MEKELLNNVIKSIGKFNSHKKSEVYLHEPNIDKNDWINVKECLKRNFVSTVGNYVNEFEEELIKFTKSKYAVAIVNGTSALHVSLKVLGVEYNDEVLMPSLNFIASANATSYCGAIPHFVEVDKDTLGVDPKKLKDYLQRLVFFKKGKAYNKKTKRRISCFILLHLFGHPSKVDVIKKILSKFKIPMIEDAAEGLGSFYKKKHLGTFGSIGVLSFNGNKIITTGSGGAILTNSKSIAKKLKFLTTTAKIPHKWRYEYSETGFNYRLAGINAALGCSQLKKLKNYIRLKRKLFSIYLKNFSGSENFEIFKEPKFSKSNYWLQTLLLKKSSLRKRDNLIKMMNDKGFSARPVWKPLHKLKHLKTCPKMNLTVTEDLEARIINLPSSAYLANHKF